MGSTLQIGSTMDSMLVERVARFAPAWLRYTVTLSEAVRTQETWVVAAGDDVALWETDTGAVMPMWPTRELAAELAEGEAQPTSIGTGDLGGQLLPFLDESEVAVTLFPNFEDDIVAEPGAVSQDLADVVTDPSDVMCQLAETPVQTAYDEWILLQMPAVEDKVSDGRPSAGLQEDPSRGQYAHALAVAAADDGLWILEAPGADAVVGVAFDDRPALALFSDERAALKFAERVDEDTSARKIGRNALVRGWLLVAHGGRWAIAISPDAESAVLVEPSRLALDLSEPGAGSERVSDS